MNAEHEHRAEQISKAIDKLLTIRAIIATGNAPDLNLLEEALLVLEPLVGLFALARRKELDKLAAEPKPRKKEEGHVP